MKIRVIFAAAVVFIATLLILLSRGEADVPLVMVSWLQPTNSLMQVVLTNRSEHPIMVWPPELEIKAAHNWTNYNDGLEAVVQVVAPASVVVITKKRPPGEYRGHLRVSYATALPDWKLTVNEWGQRIGAPPIFSYDQQSTITAESSRVH